MCVDCFIVPLVWCATGGYIKYDFDKALLQYTVRSREDSHKA